MIKILVIIISVGTAFFSAVTKSVAQINFGEVVLNEIVIAPPGTDSTSGCEYVEFRGAPNMAIDDFTYVDIEGDAEQNPGTINYIHSLRGLSTGPNGLLVLASSTSCRSFNAGNFVFAHSAVLLDPAFQSNFSIRNNGTNSFLIYAGQLPYVRGQDLDVNNDGIIDSGTTPFDGMSVVDGDNNTGDLQYGAAPLGRRSGTPSNEAVNAATRFCTDFTRNSATAFYFGDLESVPETTSYSSRPNSRSIVFPADGQLTPGALNVPCQMLITVSLNGRVLDKNGRGISKASVTISGTGGETQTAVTNPFGYFRFNNLTSNDVYTVSTAHKRHAFSGRIVQMQRINRSVTINENPSVEIS